MLTNKDFNYTVTITKQRKVNLRRGHYVTSCLTCNYTCHEDCIYNNDCDKWQCSAMDDGDINTASCRVCPGVMIVYMPTTMTSGNGVQLYMDNGDIYTARCRVCPGGGCHWTVHVNNPYYFELYQVNERRTQEDLGENMHRQQREKSMSKHDQKLSIG